MVGLPDRGKVSFHHFGNPAAVALRVTIAHYLGLTSKWVNRRLLVHDPCAPRRGGDHLEAVPDGANHPWRERRSGAGRTRNVVAPTSLAGQFVPTTASGATSPSGRVLVRDRSAPDLAVCWPDVEWQVFAVLPQFASVRARQWAVRWSIAACYSQHRDADYFSSQLDLLGNAQRVVDLDPEVTNRAFELRMPQQ